MWLISTRLNLPGHLGHNLHNYERFVLRITDTTKMYHSQKSARQSMLSCSVWGLQCMAREGLVNKLFLVGRIDSARIGSHYDVKTDLGDLEELSPYETLI